MRTNLGCISIDAESYIIEINHTCSLMDIFWAASSWSYDTREGQLEPTVLSLGCCCPCGCEFVGLYLNSRWKFNIRSLSLITNPGGQISEESDIDVGGPRKIIWERNKNV